MKREVQESVGSSALRVVEETYDQNPLKELNQARDTLYQLNSYRQSNFQNSSARQSKQKFCKVSSDGLSTKFGEGRQSLASELQNN